MSLAKRQLRALRELMEERSKHEALRSAELALQSERDRRYAEVAVEREKALRIKEEADKQALALAREIQTYKDEKANELREQIASERNLYVTKSDLQAATEKLGAEIRPLLEFMSGTRGEKVVRERDIDQSGINRGQLISIAIAVVGWIGVVLTLVLRSH